MCRPYMTSDLNYISQVILVVVRNKAMRTARNVFIVNLVRLLPIIIIFLPPLSSANPANRKTTPHDKLVCGSPFFPPFQIDKIRPNFPQLAKRNFKADTKFAIPETRFWGGRESSLLSVSKA